MALTMTDIGTGSNNTSATTLSITIPSDFNYGSSAIISLAYDNAGSQGADPYLSITDTTGNTWSTVVSVLNDPAAASAGATLRIFKSDQTTGTLLTGSVVTVTFNTATTAKVWTINMIESDTYLVNANNFNSAISTTATPSITTTALTNNNIVLGVVGGEGNGTRTGDTDTVGGNWSTAQSIGVGATTNGMEIISQWKRIASTGTNPTLVKYATGSSGGYITGGNATAVATLTSVTSGNMIVVAFDSGDKYSETQTNFSISSSPALTWTLIAEPSTTATSAHCKLFLAFATSSATHTITTSYRNASNGGSCACVAYEFSGTESIYGGASVTAINQTAPSVNITTTLNNSIVVGTYSDWNAVANTTRTSRTTVTDTYTTYWTGAFSTYNYYANTTTAGTTTHGYSVPTGQATGVILAEIRGTSSTNTQTYNPTLSASDDLCIAWVEFSESATIKPTTTTSFDPMGMMGFYGI